MGLAASQARFLAITARKMNCEFQSMQIAQEKLSTTRDLQRAADEYQNSLDATKLVWDADDMGTYDLSYDLMMRPSTLNNFTPYLITDARGKVVLSEYMFQAAMKAGIIDINGDPTLGHKEYTYISDFSDGTTAKRRSDNIQPFMGDVLSYDDKGYGNAYEKGSRNEFLYQLGLFNQVDGSMVRNILELGESGYNKSGIGGPIFDKSTANALETNDFINYLQKAKAENVTTVKSGKKYPYSVSNASGTEYLYEIGDINNGSDTNVEVYSFSAGEKIKCKSPIYYEITPDTVAEATGRINGIGISKGEKLLDVLNPVNTDKDEAGNITSIGYTFKQGDIAPFAFSVAVETESAKNELIYSVGSVFENLNGAKNVNSTKEVQEQNKAFTVVTNGKPLSDTDLSKLTIGDILRGNYTVVYNGGGAENTYREILQGLAEVLGLGDTTHVRGLNVDTESNEALRIAFNYTSKLLSSANSTSENTKDPAVLYTKAQGSTNVITSTQSNLSSISLTNLMKSYLTNFARAIDGMTTPYYIDDKNSKNCRFVTNDLSYSFVIANDGAMLDEIDLNADFYNMMYNVIAINGACTNEMLMNMVTDQHMLHEGIKNGTLFVSTLNTDGYFYQSAYSLTDKIAEVPDEDAIARAEREYEVTKSRLNTKEETLELKMKNLDMEISALTTEFDTVKNLISKGVEKVFTMFST